MRRSSPTTDISEASSSFQTAMPATANFSIVFLSLSSFFLVAFLAKILHILWRLANSRQQNRTAGGVSGDESSACLSIELIHCIVTKRPPHIDPSESHQSRLPVEESPEVIQCPGLYGPRRFLSPIDEDEMEGVEPSVSIGDCPPTGVRLPR
ncbi:hypothetical protein Nepgr_028212 [Nepenthes gracilis]|uniref:Uncharacterized protein n=1 Tax=Nepenthes gracilis TaxID=150966 RepID=A0AAD3Y3W3_NEPGR|nr:hypothetical protein Nepgr_028212 [Nepenthes gracilis]